MGPKEGITFAGVSNVRLHC